MKAFLPLFLLAATAFIGEGRPVMVMTPEELSGMAEVVVTGEVKSIRPTEDRGVRIDGSKYPLRMMEATIKAFHATKGEIPTTFVLRYPELALGGTDVVTDPPMLVSLKEGERYHFYLKKRGDFYVGVLDGEIDQGFAAQSLSPREMNASSPLFKKEAEVIARAYFSCLRPKAKIGFVEAKCPLSWDPRWQFTFFTSSPPLNYPDLTSDGEVFVDGSQSVRADSWVSLEAPREGREVSADDVGKTVRLTVAEVFGESRAVLQGKMESLGREKIRGTFSSASFGKETAQKVEFPRKALVSVQRILPYTATEVRMVREVGVSLRFPVGWRHEEKDKFGYVMKPFGEGRQKVRIHFTGYKDCTPAEAARRAEESIAKKRADQKMPQEEIRSTTPIETKSGLKGVRVTVANEKSAAAPYLYRCYFRKPDGAIFCVCLYSFGDEGFAKEGEEIIVNSLKLVK
ncbi:hypothetical protein BH09VER1_BH09VER1_02420 [soil metagenome]